MTPEFSRPQRLDALVLHHHHAMIGLVLVTHGRLASEFIHAVEHVVGRQEQIEAICIGPEDKMDLRRADIAEQLNAELEEDLRSRGEHNGPRVGLTQQGELILLPKGGVA